MTKRKRIPVESEPSVGCDNCTGACCRKGTSIWLSNIERFNHAAKFSLREIVAPVSVDRVLEPLSSQDQSQLIPPNVGFYEMLADCGYLSDEGRCTIYDQPSRPMACDGMIVESVPCLVIRANAGFNDSMHASTRAIIDAALADM